MFNLFRRKSRGFRTANAALRMYTPQDATPPRRRKVPNPTDTIVWINEAGLENSGAPASLYFIPAINDEYGTAYSALVPHLNKIAQLYWLRRPHKKQKDAELQDLVASLAEFHADALVKFHETGRLILCGFSAGAILALAIADRIRARGREVALLAAVDNEPENVGADIRKWSPFFWFEVMGNAPGRIRFKRSRGALVQDDLPASRAAGTAGHAGTSSVQGDLNLGASASEPKRKGGARRDRAHNTPASCDAILKHAPMRYDGDVILYEATSDLYPRKARKRWSRIAPRLEIVPVEGDHVSMTSEPYVSSIAVDLRNRIADLISLDYQRNVRF